MAGRPVAAGRLVVAALFILADQRFYDVIRQLSFVVWLAGYDPAAWSRVTRR